MRATITLEDEVALQLEQLGRERRASLDAVANEILRDGLARRVRPDFGKGGSPTRPVPLGGCLLPSLESVSEALARVEGKAVSRPFVVHPRALGARPGLDFDRIEGLLDEFEGPVPP